MNTTAANASKGFQISTDQTPVFLTTGDHPGSAIQTIQLDSEQHRIDAATHLVKPHSRAIQLSEFTDWLSGIPAVSTTPEPVVDTPNQASQAVSQITVAAATGGINHRIDVVATDTQPVRKPHFETRNYVAPESTEAQRTIERLQPDGRVSADNDRTPAPPAIARPIKTSFAWSDVTNRLLGSPAILNLETNVQHGLDGGPCRLLVTSVKEGTGASTVTIALARQLAKHGRRVLIVDANFSNSTLMHMLGFNSSSSWLHSVNQRRSPADLIIRDRNTPIALLPLAPTNSPVNWPDRIYDELATIIDSVAWDYDAILFDVGTVEQLVADISNPTLLGSMTLLVTSQSGESYEFFRAKSKLLTAGADNLLVVKNFSRANVAVQAKVG